MLCWHNLRERFFPKNSTIICPSQGQGIIFGENDVTSDFSSNRSVLSCPPPKQLFHLVSWWRSNSFWPWQPLLWSWKELLSFTAHLAIYVKINRPQDSILGAHWKRDRLNQIAFFFFFFNGQRTNRMMRWMFKRVNIPLWRWFFKNLRLNRRPDDPTLQRKFYENYSNMTGHLHGMPTLCSTLKR